MQIRNAINPISQRGFLLHNSASTNEKQKVARPKKRHGNWITCSGVFWKINHGNKLVAQKMKSIPRDSIILNSLFRSLNATTPVIPARTITNPRLTSKRLLGLALFRELYNRLLGLTASLINTSGTIGTITEVFSRARSIVTSNGRQNSIVIPALIIRRLTTSKLICLYSNTYIHPKKNANKMTDNIWV